MFCPVPIPISSTSPSAGASVVRRAAWISGLSSAASRIRLKTTRSYQLMRPLGSAEVLHHPDLTVGARGESAPHGGVARARHVRVVAVRGAGTRALGEHVGQAIAHHRVGRTAPAGAFVLSHL